MSLSRFVLLFFIPLFFLYGCQASSNRTNNECSNPSNLKLDKIENLDLSTESKKISGILTGSKPIGYKFNLKRKGKISYSINPPDICGWLYSPSNKIVNDTNLTENGDYVLQVNASKNSGTFDLTISFDATNKNGSSPVATSQSISPSTNSSQSKEEAKNFVVNHYQAISSKDYAKTWTNLSPSFQNSTGGYGEYTKWWNRVASVNLKSVKVLSVQNNKAALLDVELSYTLHEGWTSYDPKRRLSLVWDDSRNSWLINNKVEP
jgi:hypothetical protein